MGALESKAESKAMKGAIESGVIGCYVIANDAIWNPSELNSYNDGLLEYAEDFNKAKALWESEGVGTSMVQFCETIPFAKCCFGWCNDDIQMYLDCFPKLRDEWAHNQANKILAKHGFKIDVVLIEYRTEGKDTRIAHKILFRFYKL